MTTEFLRECGDVGSGTQIIREVSSGLHMSGTPDVGGTG